MGLHTVNVAFCPGCKQKKKSLQAGTDENISKIRKTEDPSCHSVTFWDLRKSCSVFGTFVLVQIKQTREGCRGFQSIWGLYWFLLLSESDLEFNTSISVLFQIPLHLSLLSFFPLFFIFSFHDYLPEKGFDLASQDFLLQHCHESMSKKAQRNQWLRAQKDEFWHSKLGWWKTYCTRCSLLSLVTPGQRDLDLIGALLWFEEQNSDNLL